MSPPSLPVTMPAAVINGIRDAAVVEHPVPEIGPGEVLVEVSHCGICGSDLHYLLEWGPMRAGSIEGHEYSGRVAAVGEGVEGWQVGDRVIGGPGERCGTCRFCREGRPSLCVTRGKAGVDEFQGAFARYKRCSAASLLPVPDGLSLKHAALTEPLAVSMHAITRAGGPRAGARWLVTGAGPIGYLAVAALVAEGVADVVVSEPHPRRRELCERLGATAVEPGDLEPVPRLPMDTVAEPFDVVLECSGRAVAMEQGLGQLQRGGTFVQVGAGIERPRFDPNRILLNELVVTGANCYDEDGFPRAVELLASGRLPLDLLVEPDDFRLDQLVEAAVALGEGNLARKVMIVPEVRS
jgi:(R,R)-butanediol dehydrogenase/meso-butanediol dehydrogenase/diacetyl reductase